MKIDYDAEADALYIQLKEEHVHRTEDLDNGVVLDFGADGTLLGIEILFVSATYNKEDILHLNTRNLIHESI